MQAVTHHFIHNKVLAACACAGLLWGVSLIFDFYRAGPSLCVSLCCSSQTCSVSVELSSAGSRTQPEHFFAEPSKQSPAVSTPEFLSEADETACSSMPIVFPALAPEATSAWLQVRSFCTSQPVQHPFYRRKLLSALRTVS